MMRTKRLWTLIGLVMLTGPLAAWLGPGVVAQGAGTITGTIIAVNGAPFPGLVVILKSSETGQTYQMTTDKDGHFLQVGVRSGIYEVTVKKQEAVIYTDKVRIVTGEEKKLDVNFKELVAKQGAAQTEAVHKQEEEKKTFETLKAHFDAGVAALDQARTVRLEMMRTPADQRGPLQEKLSGLNTTAVGELESAQKSAGEADANMHIILAKPGDAYEVAGRYDDAVAAYQKAVALKPDQANYYNNLGNSLAKAGRIEEAGQAYQKSAMLDPPNAASAWRNFGIVLFNANKMKEAVDPLKKSLEIDPKSAQGWYLLGAALVNTMGFKQEGSKVIPILQPGTVEAYEKAVELDPNGPYGSQARQGLEQLQAMGLGIETKIKTKGTKK